MDEARKYILTLRDEDLFELYPHIMRYKIFSARNPELILMAACLPFCIWGAIGMLWNTGYFFLLIFSVFGFGALLVRLLEEWHNVNMQKKYLIHLLEYAHQFDSHHVYIQGTSLHYISGNTAPRVYDIKAAAEVHLNQSFFYLKEKDNWEWVLLSAKSFEAGDYQVFEAAVREITADREAERP